MTIAEPQPAIDALLATRLRNAQPALWTNAARQARPAAAMSALGRTISLDDTKAAVARLARFAGLLAQGFPELAATGGVVESPLLPAAALQPALDMSEGQGRLFIKADHSLPVAGSIKARGGMHEVLEFAEGLALKHGLVQPGGDYRALATRQARRQNQRSEATPRASNPPSSRKARVRNRAPAGPQKKMPRPRNSRS